MEAKVEFGKLQATFSMERDEIIFTVIGVFGGIATLTGFTAIWRMVF